MDWRIGALCKPYKKGDNCGQYVETLQTKKVWNHPNYKKKTDDNDFALIQLKSKSTVTPVPMDDDPVDFYTQGMLVYSHKCVYIFSSNSSMNVF